MAKRKKDKLSTLLRNALVKREKKLTPELADDLRATSDEGTKNPASDKDEPNRKN